MTLTAWGEWPPTIDPNIAYKSLNNLSNSTIPATDYSNYSAIQNFTRISFTNSSQSAQAVAVPVNEVLVPVFGYWLYVIIILFLSLLMYAKTESLGATSITIMLLSSLAVGPDLVGVHTIPAGVSSILYVLAGLGLAGSFLSWLIEK
ncbi:hypothetical protein [Methanosarcina acetivorans]|uniref:Uncharacterized protein n=1 Tax=Methanosarcina acetivorans (strain ATCC 35395 / DSM 2834 / JCM 12185 / C2A) TaxID=188937 RepID=Q8TL13_METAC|nr:hypothetical protein [Methanosarcina acetivorans]AAM06601.1 predicted protein [Methanosarcina acetivorans C2A]